MNRRQCLLMALALPGTVQAHHGWSSFDQDRPIYLEGRVVKSMWRNPHAELVIEVPEGLRIPADLAQRAVPAQSVQLDGQALLARAALPKRKDRQWEVELAPLIRLEAWKLAEVKPGAQVGVLGYTFKEEKGGAVLRGEYLFVEGKAYGLRSSPV